MPTWSKEVPEESGWYPVVKEGGTKTVVYFSSPGITTSHGPVSRMKYWGPQVSFDLEYPPEPPQDGWYEGKQGTIRYVKDGRVYPDRSKAFCPCYGEGVCWTTVDWSGMTRLVPQDETE